MPEIRSRNKITPNDATCALKRVSIMSDNIRAVCEAFPDGFEAACPVEGWVIKESGCTYEWYNSQLEFMHLLLGFRPPELIAHDISGLNSAYAYAFVVYWKMCKLSGRTHSREPDMMFLEPPPIERLEDV